LTVDEIENETGIDFFSGLDDKMEINWKGAFIMWTEVSKSIIMYYSPSRIFDFI